MNWLVAEDEADIRMLIAAMCQVWGHSTLLFESGQKAWDWLDELEAGKHTGEIPDLVLMDIRMPGKKGNEVAQRMRALAAFNRVPIILMTAFSLTEAERKTMMQDDGVDLIIHKPLPDFEELRVMLHNIHTRRQTA